MPLYNPQSPVTAAHSAMSGATQAAAAQTKKTKQTTEGGFWDDFYKGTAGVANMARGIGGLVDAAESVTQMYDTHKMRNAYDSINKTFQEGGFDAIQNNPDMQDFYHRKAFGQFMVDRANSEKGRLEMMNTMDANNDRLYQNWRAQAGLAAQSYNSGDMEQFDQNMVELSKITPMPWKIEPNGDGNFRVMFRSDKDLEFSDTGKTMSRQELMGMVNNMQKGEQMVLRGMDGKLVPMNPDFLSAAARHQYVTILGNAENSLDPQKMVQLIGPGGKRGTAVIENSWTDYGMLPQILVYDDATSKQIGRFSGRSGLLEAGWRQYDPKMEKGTGGDGIGDWIGPGTPFDSFAAEAGYIWDKNDKRYYGVEQDNEGKWEVNKSKPMSREVRAAIAAKMSEASGSGNDPMELRKNDNSPPPDTPKPEIETPPLTKQPAKLEIKDLFPEGIPQLPGKFVEGYNAGRDLASESPPVKLDPLALAVNEGIHNWWSGKGLKGIRNVETR